MRENFDITDLAFRKYSCSHLLFNLELLLSYRGKEGYEELLKKKREEGRRDNMKDEYVIPVGKLTLDEISILLVELINHYTEKIEEIKQIHSPQVAEPYLEFLHLFEDMLEGIPFSTKEYRVLRIPCGASKLGAFVTFKEMIEYMVNGEDLAEIMKGRCKEK